MDHEPVTIDDKPRVLIVDDARENVRILANILKDDASLAFSLDGRDALEKTASIKPDLILLDIEMPDMDGYEVLKRIKAEPQLASIPVIFVTSHASAQNEEEGLRLGAIDYITKPFNPSIVKARVRNQLLLRAYAKNLEELNVELERLATTDALTGIPNRRAFQERANREILRIDRYGGSACLMMLDIDHFKQVNDTYGHDAGDEVLRIFASRIDHRLRETDILGRLGGEEFAVFSLEVGIDAGSHLADRLLQDIRSTPITWQNHVIPVTSSIGVTLLKEGERSLDEALARADKALYRAKKNGRDRVEAELEN